MGQILFYFFWAALCMMLIRAIKSDPSKGNKKKADQAKKDENRIKGRIDEEGDFGKYVTIIFWTGLVLGLVWMTLKG